VALFPVMWLVEARIISWRKEKTQRIDAGGEIDLQLAPLVSGLLALDFARASLRRIVTSPGWLVNTASPLAVTRKERREDYQNAMMRENRIHLVSGALL
jgi:hypothetical protein